MTSQLKSCLRAVLLAFAAATSTTAARADRVNGQECHNDAVVKNAIEEAFRLRRAPGNRPAECLDLLVLLPIPPCNIDAMLDEYKARADRFGCKVPPAVDAEFSTFTSRQAVERGKVYYDFAKAHAANPVVADNNYWTAHAWFLKAGADGEAYALLSELYHYGLGVARNGAVAMDYAQLSMNAHNRRAFGMMGMFYEDGIFQPVDYARALGYYRDGQQGNDTWSTYRYGYLLAHGYGTRQDLEQSINFLSKARRMAREDANRDLEKWAADELAWAERAQAASDQTRRATYNCNSPIVVGRDTRGQLLRDCD